MPLYTYECKSGHRTEAIRRIADRHDALDCSTCGQPTEMRIVPTQVQPVLGGGNFPGYYCVVDDTWVSSRKQRREIIKKHDLVERG